jgi:hypothetical protein
MTARSPEAPDALFVQMPVSEASSARVNVSRTSVVGKFPVGGGGGGVAVLN